MAETTQQTKPYLQQLNPVQRQAVTNTDGPVLVVAGPGSGKTRVLTYRIAHMIQEGVKPWEILALTFTNKAAREMKERIEKVVGERANKVWAGTFHSIFARILRVEAEKIGYPSNFTIYDTEDSKSLIGTIIKEMNLSKDAYNVNAIRARISSAKSNLITPRLYADNQELMQQDRTAKRPYIQQIYEKYVARCKRAGAMDFDDLLYRLFELLHKNPDNVLEKYREKFKYVLVDEFQDTNHLQYRIVLKLVQYEGSPRNICVVGDDAQSIYGFRGATIQNILDFEEDFKKFGIQVFKLEQNYRSTDHIVKAANEVITYNQKQIPKTIWSDKGAGERIKLIKAITDTEEGKRVVDTILEQKNRFHLSNQDIAILYRTNSQSRIFEEYLRRYNITYRVYGGLSFYQRKEVKDVIAYLRLVVNPADEEALRRVINFPKRGIGDTTIDKISQIAADTNRTMWESLPDVHASTRAKNSIDGFREIIQKGQQKAETSDAYEAANYIVRQSGLIDMMKSDTTIEGMGRMENVNALLDGIKEFVESDLAEEVTNVSDKSLASYLQNIALLTDFDQGDTDTDFVTLMTVHSAKGLEFKSVFVVGLEEKMFPSFMSLDSAEGIDEERRLFYVAITRAEAFLTLSYAGSRYRFGQMRYNEASRFLEEIDLSHLDAVVPASGGKFTMEPAAPRPPSSGVQGNFKSANNNFPVVDLKNFKPSPMEQIQKGQQVLHQKFGKGEVLLVDGERDKLMATIKFHELEGNAEKRLVLKYAKLQILE